MAWAAGVDEQWWEPSFPYFWPSDECREPTLQAAINAYETLGFAACADGSAEEGFEKVAFFVSEDGLLEHAARQLPSGRWTSKMGRFVDIEHDLQALEAGQYGNVKAFLKRPR